MSTVTKTGGRDATNAVVPGRGLLSIGDPKTPVPNGYSWTGLASVARMESGHTPSRRKPEYWNEGIPWIGIKDATGNDGQVIQRTHQSISQLGVDNSSTRLLPAGTVSLSRTASVGYVVQMGVPMCTSQDFVNWVCGPELNPNYLRYLLLAEAESVRSWATGSTHKTLYFPEAKALHAMLPSKETQKRVGNVLGALDDKVAANHNINSLASRLLLSKYRRTGKERTDVTFEKVAEIGGGATPSTKKPELWGQGVVWATPTDVTGLQGLWLDRTARTISPAGLASISSPLYPVGSVAMTSRATIGACVLLGEPMAVNQGFIVLQPHDPSTRIWLYCQLLDRVEELKAWANGATFLELPKNIFRQLPVELGSEPDMREFSGFAEQLVERMHALQRESARLAATRDELLPLLMSGKITVKDAEKTVEEVV